MRAKTFRSKAALIAGLVLIVVFVAALLVPQAFARYRTQLVVKNTISYKNQQAGSFSMSTGILPDGAQTADGKAAEPGDTFTYALIPGTTVHVKPVITITDKTEIPSLLYVEVCASKGLHFTVENGLWTYLDGLTGLNGGLVYVYNGDLSDASSEIPVEAAITADKTPSAGEQFVFYSYLIQKEEGSSAAETFAAAVSQETAA